MFGQIALLALDFVTLFEAVVLWALGVLIIDSVEQEQGIADEVEERLSEQLEDIQDVRLEVNPVDNSKKGGEVE